MSNPSLNNISSFRRSQDDQRVSALSAGASKLGPRLFSNKNSKKRNNYSFPPIQDTYQIFEGRSINGSITRKYFYKNGQRCDAFGRTTQELGYTPTLGIEQHRPISYPTSNQNINKDLNHQKKNYYKTWGLDQDLLLKINKLKLLEESEKDVNIRGHQFSSQLEDKVAQSKGKSKGIHSKIFNPLNKNITTLITSDDILFYYSNYPIQVSESITPKVAYKDLNLRDKILDKFMSTN